jgi:hypothetical protein
MVEKLLTEVFVHVAILYCLETLEKAGHRLVCKLVESGIHSHGESGRPAPVSHQEEINPSVGSRLAYRIPTCLRRQDGKIERRRGYGGRSLEDLRFVRRLLDGKSFWSFANDEREYGKFRKLRIMFVFGAEMCTGHNSMLYLAPHINRKQRIAQRTI